jgi:carbamoyl-phosphate synthase large subunit
MKDLTSLKILVTGACGVTSRSVVRSLKISSAFSNSRFVGTDVCDNLYGISEGLYDVLYRVPRSTDDGYSDIVHRICEQEAIDLAIVIPEMEVLHWTRQKMSVPCLLPPEAFCRTAGSKVDLYRMLENSGSIPRFEIACRETLMSPGYAPASGWPCWIRDYEIGSTSGRGSLLAANHDELKAWIVLNQKIESFMVSEFLPGRNFACHLLYHEGKLIKVGIYERLSYFMARIAPSGVSGNISQGRLLNDERILEVSRSAVEFICREENEIMQGLVAVDLREDASGKPMITEINLRHVACTSAFASAGHNLAEAQVFATLGMPERAGALDHSYPPANLILRDIDGPALWVPGIDLPPVGHAVKGVP